MQVCADIVLQQNAIFIADSHFKRDDFHMLDCFSNLDKNAQVFLMGDIFHLLLGNLKTSLDINRQMLDVILGLDNEIIYLEGNHDMHVVDAFCDSKNIRVFKRKHQPVVIKDYRGNTCILSHGDIFISSTYEKYITMYDNPLFMGLLVLLDRASGGALYSFISNMVYGRSIRLFPSDSNRRDSFVLDRVRSYREHVIDRLSLDSGRIYIIEGHFHLGFDKSFENIHYVGLDSFYFVRSYRRFDF